MSSLTLYCLDWHIEGGSVLDLIVDPLRPYADVKLIPWDGSSLGVMPKDPTEVIWFHQLPPSVEEMSTLGGRIVWSPMWDHARGYTQAWWNKLPKAVRIVAFSEAVANRAETAGLPTVRLKYYADPNRFPPVLWGQERVMMYWNRTGLVGPKLLQRLCDALGIDTLLFKNVIDPLISRDAAYELPSTLGRTVVEGFDHIKDREEYYRLLRRANVYIAPRKFEGVGLTFLEALASGCAVLGHNAPTMNEYIGHGQDGFLLKRKRTGWSLRRVKRALRRRASYTGLVERPCFEFALSDDQSWSEISALDLAALGRRARLRQEAGFRRWRSGIEHFARFVLLR